MQFNLFCFIGVDLLAAIFCTSPFAAKGVSVFVPLPRVTLGLTVLGLTLFLIYINDNNISSNIRLFADDCLLYRTINSTSDNIALQEDLNKLVHWSNVWEMDFNVKGEILETISQHPYLGVELTSLIFILTISLKSSSTLGFLKRNLKKLSAKSERMSLGQPSTSQVGIGFTFLESVSKTQVKQLE